MKSVVVAVVVVATLLVSLLVQPCKGDISNNALVRGVVGGGVAGDARDVLVGAHYFAGWSRSCVFANGSSIPGCYSHFHGYTPLGAPVLNFFDSYPSRVPLLGNLTTDVDTVTREVHAADAAGLDFFDILYYDGGHDCGMPPSSVAASDGAAGNVAAAATTTNTTTITAGQQVDPGPDPGLRWCLDSTLAFMLNTSSVWANTTGRLHFYLTYSNDIDKNTPGAFVGAAGLAKWDALVHTWTTAMAHPRYLRIGGRPVFKVLIPDIFVTVECQNNETLATALLDRLRNAATSQVRCPVAGTGVGVGVGVNRCLLAGLLGPRCVCVHVCMCV